MKIAHWLESYIQQADHNTDIINLQDADIPLWTEDAWNNDSALSAQLRPYQERVKGADALIIISPEYAGMAPANLKNFLLYISSEQAAHKPCLLVGVSAGRGGTYPISELHAYGFKNNRIACIPDHLIIQDAQNVMNSQAIDEGSDADIYIKKRALYSLNTLYAYGEALKTMRSQNTLLDKDYPFGM